MSTPNGYNNPAYSHQFDPSLYDYQYVPEIDPDSPDLRQESNRRQPQTKLVHPSFQGEPSDSSEFEGSDESNRSIIVEECNNRRVTLICEKRKRAEEDEFYGGGRGAYYQDISLESETGQEVQGNKTLYGGRQNEERSFRHQRPLEPPVEQPVRILASCSNNDNVRISRNLSFKQSTTSVRSHQRPERYHRYEEIPYDDECSPTGPKLSASVHRYAEITPDENGYPTLSKQIEIEQNFRDRHHQKENLPPKPTSKPRAISPINYPDTFSPPATPSRTHRQTNKDFDFGVPRFSPNSPSPIIYSSSPVKSNSFEMSELSPPRLANDTKRANDHTLFIQSAKRQPPIGASPASEALAPNERCILPRNLQQFITKPAKRCHSLPNSPRKRRDFAHQATPPGESQSSKKISQIFHKPTPTPKHKPNGGLNQKTTPARRNISNLFGDDYPASQQRSPYKSTTTEIAPPKTAIITPIFQRKNQQSQQHLWERSPKESFEKMSQAFQSTGNIFRSARETSDLPDPTRGLGRLASPARIKRNQSVPNFSQTMAAESRMATRKSHHVPEQSNLKYSRNLDLQYSPKKPLEHVSAIDKSRMSLIEQSSSWSNLDSNAHPRCSLCFIFAAVVHLVTASATCAISFYLLSKVGRKYYLDFGLLAGFVNFILGLLGFRSYCWRWIPNRNYVSGFVVLAAFSAFTCGGLSYIITARPMAGHPIMDIMGGAICAVSVLTIVLALTGLTMSGCCKAPPPDNRVADV